MFCYRLQLIGFLVLDLYRKPAEEDNTAEHLKAVQSLNDRGVKVLIIDLNLEMNVPIIPDIIKNHVAKSSNYFYGTEEELGCKYLQREIYERVCGKPFS